MSTKKYNAIRLKLSKLFVREKTKTNRKVTPISLQKAKKVGLFFAVENNIDIDNALYVYNQLKNIGVSAVALGYVVNYKDLAKYREQSFFDFFTDKDLDFLYRTKTDLPTTFVDTEFDVLIDINAVDYYPTRLMLSQSKAHFRIGLFAENHPFDLMLCVEKEKGCKYYYEQIEFYLQKFN